MSVRISEEPALDLPSHPVGRRLWMAGAGVALCAILFAAVHLRALVPRPGQPLRVGEDLLAAYAAGSFLRDGNPPAMYDLPALQRREAEIMRAANLEGDPRFAPWLNPPFFAWPFAPLAALPYRRAALVWLGVNLALFTGSLVMLRRMLPQSCTWRDWGLLPLLLLVSMPLWQAMGSQQNSFLSLALLCATASLWRARRPLAAGACAGLLFYKPQLALAVAGILALAMGWRALAGLAITGSILLAMTILTLPGTLDLYVHRLPATLHWLQNECPYNWGRQITFQSFWRLVLQGHTRGETHSAARALWWASSGAVAIALAAATIKVRRDALAQDRLIAATIACMPLLMPYYMDYDLVLLALPAVLLAREWIDRGGSSSQVDRWLAAGWAVLFFALEISPALSSNTRLNIAVPCLAFVALLSLQRCFSQAAAIGNPQFIVRARAAA